MPITNIKLCKECGKGKRYANTSFCYSCYRLREKEKKEAKILRKKERKEKSLGFIKSIKKKLHKQAWGLMSEVVRREGTDSNGFGDCYTCRKIIHWKDANACHRYHGKLDFDFRNIKRGCVHCNKYLDGNLGAYEHRLIEENSLEWAKQLERDAWAKGNDYSIEELKEIIRYLTKKLEDLK